MPKMVTIYEIVVEEGRKSKVLKFIDFVMRVLDLMGYKEGTYIIQSRTIPAKDHIKED